MIILNRIQISIPSFTNSLQKRMGASSLSYRLAHGAFWSISGAAISRGLMLLASIIVARILGQDTYGEFGIIRSTVSMFLVFAGFGLGMTATKHVAEYRSIDPLRTARIIALSGRFALITGLLISCALFIFASWFASHTLNAPQLTSVLKIGALILFLNALNGAQTGALAGLEVYKIIAKINLTVGIISFPLLITGAYLWGLKGAVWALAINMFINWFLNHLAIRSASAQHNIPFSTKDCLKEWPILWRFCLPAALGGILISPAIWASNAMLVNEPNGYTEMAIYDAANQWRMAILFIPSAISQIILPMLANLNSEDNQPKYLKALKYNALINGTVALFVAIPVIFLAHMIMASYGTEYLRGNLALMLLALSTFFVSLNNVIGQAIASKGKMWIGFLFNFWWAVTYLALSYYFISMGYGVTGLAIANLIAYLLHSIWQSIYMFCYIVPDIASISLGEQS